MKNIKNATTQDILAVLARDTIRAFGAVNRHEARQCAREIADRTCAAYHGRAITYKQVETVFSAVNQMLAFCGMDHEHLYDAEIRAAVKAGLI